MFWRILPLIILSIFFVLCVKKEIYIYTAERLSIHLHLAPPLLYSISGQTIHPDYLRQETPRLSCHVHHFFYNFVPLNWCIHRCHIYQKFLSTLHYFQLPIDKLKHSNQNYIEYIYNYSSQIHPIRYLRVFQ